MKKFHKDSVIVTGLIVAFLMLAACSDNDSEAMMEDIASYEVKVYNITHDQPLTPVAVIAHKPAYQPWQLGSAASTGLEMLAESGDASQLVAEAEINVNVLDTAVSMSGPFAPGAVETVSVSVVASSDLQISVASMLANSNDAFTGMSAISVAGLSIGESKTYLLSVYDAGTELNTESAATMPGPAAMGEGFNATRDDVDFVSVHPGIVSSDDGLPGSVLNEGHRWQGAAAKLVVTRM